MQRAIMQLNPFLSVIYLMGKLFKLISQNICKKSSADGLLSWHGNAMNAMEGSQMNCSELKWVRYWEETRRPQPIESQWAVPLSPPAASPVFIKFELGLKSVIICLISGSRTHRIIPDQTTSPLPRHQVWAELGRMGQKFPFPWSGWSGLNTDCWWQRICCI